MLDDEGNRSAVNTLNFRLRASTFGTLGNQTREKEMRRCRKARTSSRKKHDDLGKQQRSVGHEMHM